MLNDKPLLLLDTVIIFIEMFLVALAGEKVLCCTRLVTSKKRCWLMK